MHIEKAAKLIHNLTDDELFRYAQLCEVEIVNYKTTITHYTPEQMRKYGVPYIQSMKDYKATFLAELETRKAKESFPTTPKTGFTK